MNGIFINSDVWNFFLGSPDQMTEQGIRDDVDFYTASGGVEAVFYNMNFQRAFFPSKVFTPIWKDCSLDADGNLLLRGKRTDNSYKNLVFNALLLHKNVPSFMSLRYRLCRERGVEMWHSMRMNDVHYTPMQTEHLPQHGDLWQERKDLIRAWYRHTWRSDWHDNAFDYAKKEVFDYHLVFLKEYLFDYESDGIELDWLRSVPLFRPGSDERNRNILTEFMRNARALADAAGKKWGHPLRIAVRVPARVQEAISTGMDVPTWVRENLADIVIPSPNNTSTENDTQVDLWKMVLPERDDLILAPCIDCTLGSARGYFMPFTEETDNGFASAFYHLGADTMYFYNHFPSNHFPGTERFFGYAGDRREVEKRARRHVLTRHDCVGEGRFQELCYPEIIWKHCCNGSVRINAGGGTEGRSATVVLGTRVPVKADLLLNTVPCEALPPETPLPEMPKGKAFYLQAKVPAGVLHDGWNALEIFNCGENDIPGTDLVWSEIRIDAAE